MVSSRYYPGTLDANCVPDCSILGWSSRKRSQCFALSFRREDISWRRCHQAGTSQCHCYVGILVRLQVVPFISLPFGLSYHSQRASTLHQLAIDSLDVWLPATGLGLVDVNDGVAGILGFVFASLYKFRYQINFSSDSSRRLWH